MAVTIDSGPVEAEDFLRDVPQNKWRLLMLARRHFMEVKLSHDCRCLVQFVNDAELMFGALGFTSANDMVRKGYGLKPEEINVAVEWLRLNPPKEPIPLKVAVKLGKRGRPKKGEEKGDNVTLNGRGNSRAYTLARLDRDEHTELAGKVRSGEMSANAAAIQMGYRKRPTFTCPECGHKFTK